MARDKTPAQPAATTALPTTDKPRRQLDPEIQAMAKIDQLMVSLTPEASGRIVTWLRDKYVIGQSRQLWREHNAEMRQQLLGANDGEILRIESTREVPANVVPTGIAGAGQG